MAAANTQKIKKLTLVAIDDGKTTPLVADAAGVIKVRDGQQYGFAVETGGRAVRLEVRADGQARCQAIVGEGQKLVIDSLPYTSVGFFYKAAGATSFPAWVNPQKSGEVEVVVEYGLILRAMGAASHEDSKKSESAAGYTDFQKTATTMVSWTKPPMFWADETGRPDVYKFQLQRE